MSDVYPETVLRQRIEKAVQEYSAATGSEAHVAAQMAVVVAIELRGDLSPQTAAAFARWRAKHMRHDP